MEIVFYLLENPILKHKDILKNLDISPSTLSYHLNILENKGIIEVFPHGKEKGYKIKNREEIINLIEKYNLKIELEKAIEHFKNIWMNLRFKDMLD